MKDIQTGESQPAPAISRRRDIRLEPPPSLTVVVSGTRANARIRDISTSGVCLLADVPLRLGTIHEVTLTIGPRTVSRRVRVVHCRRNIGRWQIGLQFLAPSPGQKCTVETIVNIVLEQAIRFD